MHAALQEFYTALINAEGDGRPVPVLADLLRMGEAHARRAFGPDDIDEALRQIRAMLTNVLEALEDNAAEQIEAIERKTVYAYTAADGTTHTMDAKLDRVDRLRDRTVRVIDYKTGQASKKLLEPDAGDLQLGIYAMALPHLLQEPEIPAGVAEYWCLSEGKKGVINLADLKLDKVRKTIDKAAAGILNGEFLRGKECGGFCTLLG